MKTPKKRTMLLLLGALAVSACSRPGPGPLQMAVRSVAIDLTFADEDLAEPVEPEVIVRTVPAPSEVEQPEEILDFDEPDPPPSAPVPDLTCGEAPDGAAAQSITTLGIDQPPAAGRYPRHNAGQFTVSGGVVDLTVPFPFFTADVISKPEVVPSDPLTGLVDEGLAGDEAEPDPLEWDVTHEITQTSTVRTRYRLTPDALQIAERETTNQDVVQLFRPEPPVTLMELNEGEGHTWVSSGVDLDRGKALLVDGTIETREPIDVCGTLVDTYRVMVDETFVDLDTGEVSGTEGDTRNRYNIATQFGGLVVETHQQYTQRTRDPESGSPMTVTYDYVSTLDDTEPS